jgi:hypothetical protein
MNKSNSDRFCECSRADFERQNNIAHNVMDPGDRR